MDDLLASLENPLRTLQQHRFDQNEWNNLIALLNPNNKSHVDNLYWTTTILKNVAELVATENSLQCQAKIWQNLVDLRKWQTETLKPPELNNKETEKTISSHLHQILENIIQQQPQITWETWAEASIAALLRETTETNTTAYMWANERRKGANVKTKHASNKETEETYAALEEQLTQQIDLTPTAMFLGVMNPYNELQDLARFGAAVNRPFTDTVGSLKNRIVIVPKNASDLLSHLATKYKRYWETYRAPFSLGTYDNIVDLSTVEPILCKLYADNPNQSLEKLWQTAYTLAKI